MYFSSKSYSSVMNQTIRDIDQIWNSKKRRNEEIRKIIDFNIDEQVGVSSDVDFFSFASPATHSTN
jgi:Arc/MetJ-type ribon-helix-helix transcriptional regulator